MSTEMDIQQVLQTLPHRYPFLLVDRVLQLDPGVYCKALKNVTINEPFFPGHFPVRPVMPGVLIIESLAQAAAMLAFKTKGTEAGRDKVVYLVGVDEARFKRPVVPGDQLRIEIKVVHGRPTRIKAQGKAFVGDQCVAEVMLVCVLQDKGGAAQA